MRCNAITKQGKQCRNNALTDAEYCVVHATADASTLSTKSPVTSTTTREASVPALGKIAWLQLDPLINLMRGNRKLRSLGLAITIVLFIASFMFVWYCWFVWLVGVWHWSFDETGWHTFAGLYAIFMLAGGPLYVPFVAGYAVIQVLNLYNEDQEKLLSQAVSRTSQAQEEAEDYLQHELGSLGTAGLVPLLRYSRVQLESYYEIGLSQTQRSFRYSIIAMWIGFLIIVLGLLYQVIPFQELGLPAPNTDIAMVSLAGGAVVEVISALFLWVYRSSIAQLTYFYNRQMYNHGILMAFRIAQSMDEGDETKKTIVKKMLSQAWQVDRPSAPSSAGIRQLFPGSKKG